jgi:hypothetical protein
MILEAERDNTSNKTSRYPHLCIPNVLYMRTTRWQERRGCWRACRAGSCDPGAGAIGNTGRMTGRFVQQNRWTERRGEDQVFVEGRRK